MKSTDTLGIIEHITTTGNLEKEMTDFRWPSLFHYSISQNQVKYIKCTSCRYGVGIIKLQVCGQARIHQAVK